MPVRNGLAKIGPRILRSSHSPHPQGCRTVSRPCRRCFNRGFMRVPDMQFSLRSKDDSEETPDAADNSRAIQRSASNWAQSTVLQPAVKGRFGPTDHCVCDSEHQNTPALRPLAFANTSLTLGNRPTNPCITSHTTPITNRKNGKSQTVAERGRILDHDFGSPMQGPATRQTSEAAKNAGACPRLKSSFHCRPDCENGYTSIVSRIAAMTVTRSKRSPNDFVMIVVAGRSSGCVIAGFIGFRPIASRTSRKVFSESS